jgi:3'-phosphoadenosine 5'-phosphosulfate sulfotransferase (PAPS reductase)/FAD synthetase
MNNVDFYLEDLKSKFAKIDFDKYFLAYSGGKDSHFLYWFIKEYLKDEKIEIVSCDTFMEHPEIKARMIKNADTILKPKLTPNKIKKLYGSPCFNKLQDEYIRRYQNGSRAKSTMEFIKGEKTTMFKLNKKARELLLNDNLHKVSPKCCDILKKEPIKEFKKRSGKKEILGITQGESKLRASKYKTCFTKTGKFTPLHDLSGELLNDIYKQYNIELPNVYKTLDKTGCVGCPYGRKIELELSTLNKAQRKFVCEYFKESYNVLGIKTTEDEDDKEDKLRDKIKSYLSMFDSDSDFKIDILQILNEGSDGNE